MAPFTDLFALALSASAGLKSRDDVSDCTSAVLGLVQDPGAAACLNADGLISLGIDFSPNADLVEPVTNWIEGMCTASPCSDVTIEHVVSTIVNACEPVLLEKLSTLDLPGGFEVPDVTLPSTEELVAAVQFGYPYAREVLCLADTDSNGDLCITKDLQSVSGAMNEDFNVTSIFAKVSTDAGGFAQSLASTDIDCTPCLKGTYSTVKKLIDSAGASVGDAENTVSDHCGADFVDGSMPSNIKPFESASKNTTLATVPTNGAEAALSSRSGLTSAALVMVTAAMAFFA